MALFRELARAKVNLSLKVLGRRPDGYHEIESIVLFADDPADRLTLTPGPGTSIKVDGPFGSGIAGENLIATTLRMLGEAEPLLVLGDVVLEKNLPVASGIGGGSADAAALLRAVRRANPAYSGVVDWQAVALRLGADVPVCLFDRAAMMRGIGEHLTPISSSVSIPAVLANPMVRVPDDKTAQVFRRLGAAALAAPLLSVAPDIDTPSSLMAFLSRSGNDLTEPALEVVPEIGGVLAGLAQLEGCSLARLSGAGPTCFGLFPSHAVAQEASRQLKADHPTWWVTPATLR